MKLTKIEVRGLFGEYDYDIQVYDPITFVHSPNGMGKSTIMRAVSEILNGDYESVSACSFERIDLCFDDESDIVVENEAGKLRVQLSRSGLESSLSPEEIKNLMGCTYIGPERMFYTNGDGTYVSVLRECMSKLASDIRAAHGDCEIVPVSNPQCDLGEAELDRLFHDCIAKVDFMGQIGLSPTIPSGYRFPPNRYELSQNLVGYRGLAVALKDWCDRYYPFAESVVVFGDIINTIFLNKTISFNELGYPEARMDVSGTVLPLEKFSSGEKQILVMFYSLLFHSSKSRFVIIDEPEVSLHISWQQQLGRFFRDIAKLRDLQIIVATHAPAVIHDDWDLAVELSNIRS